MQPFTRLDAIAAPLPVANVDTDKILAGRFLKTTTREGLGDKLFWALRRDPAFVLNRAPWDRATMLVARDNFGCGSSREHAPWALLDFGISCVVAPSFADIFYNNCFKNGLLPIVLPEAAVEGLLRLAADPTTARMTVDLPAQTIVAGDAVIRFDIDPSRKRDLIEGIDEIAATLGHGDAIARFEARYAAAMPWVSDVAGDALAAD